MKRLVTYFIACLVMLVTASGALAQMKPCAGDIARLCSNIPPGNGYIADCLSRNEAQLSPACKSLNLTELAEVVRQTQQVCASDIVSFCPTQQGGALLSCMWQWLTSLSPDCRAKLTEAVEMMRY